MLAALKAFAAAQQAKKEDAEGVTPAPPAKKQDTTISLLMEHLAQPRKERSAAVVHASDLTKDSWCPRATTLFKVSNAPPESKYLDVAMRVTFDNGNAMASIIINKYLTTKVLGGWECLKCGDYHVGRKPAAESVLCKHLWRYKELAFTHPKLDFTGSIDLFLDVGRPDGKVSVVELKTMNPEEFKKLGGPLAEHRVRTALYLELLASQSKLPFPVQTDSAQVLYVSRGHGCKNDDYDGEILPFKEYTVLRDDSVLKDAHDRARLVSNFNKGGKMPLRTCLEQWTAPAKYCKANVMCFSGKYA